MLKHYLCLEHWGSLFAQIIHHYGRQILQNTLHIYLLHLNSSETELAPARQFGYV